MAARATDELFSLGKAKSPEVSLAKLICPRSEHENKLQGLAGVLITFNPAGVIMKV